MGDRQVTAAMRRAAGVFGCSPDASDDQVEAALCRAHADGDLTWDRIQRLRAGEPIEIDVAEPVAPAPGPAAARPAGREYDCHLCGAGISPADAERAARWTGLGWRLFCPACAERAELFAGGVSDGE